MSSHSISSRGRNRTRTLEQLDYTSYKSEYEDVGLIIYDINYQYLEYEFILLFDSQRHYKVYLQLVQ